MIIALRQPVYSQASVTDEKDSPSQLAIPSSTSSTKSSSNAEPDTTPQDLGDKCGILGQGYIDDTKARSSGLSDDDILRPEELSNTRPQVRLRNDIVGLLRDGVGERRNVDLLSSLAEFCQLGRQVWKEPLEADSGVEGVQNSGVVGMKLIRKDESAASAMRPDLEVIPYLDSLAPRDVIREVPGIEVAEHRSDRDDQFRTLDLLKDFRVSN